MLCIIPLSVPLIGLVNCSNIVENATSPQVTYAHSTKYFTNNARNIPNGTHKANGNARILIIMFDSNFCRPFKLANRKKQQGNAINIL